MAFVDGWADAAKKGATGMAAGAAAGGGVGSLAGAAAGQWGNSTGQGIFTPLSGGNTPQQKGYGISGSNASGKGYQPYNTTGPMTPDARDPYAGQRFSAGRPNSGAPTRQPTGWDFASPGTAEQYWNNQQGRIAGPSQSLQAYQQTRGAFGAPGAGEQYWNQIRGRNNGPTNSQQVFQQTQAQDPGLGAYYDRAQQQLEKNLTRQFGSRGMARSSDAINKTVDATVALGAERANREGDFNLRQSQLLGQLGGQADQSNMNQASTLGQLAFGAQDRGLARAMGMGQMAQGADASELSRFNGGMQGAMGAQDARRQRGRDFVGDLAFNAGAMSGMAGNTYDNMLGGDQSYMDGSIGMNLGGGREALNQNYRTQDKIKQDLSWFGDFGGGQGGQGGMGGMGQGLSRMAGMFG
jgi:hypothetical protein